MTTTILIKRNADKNYDRLFVVVEASVLFGRGESLSEKQTTAGYAVTFKSLDRSVIDWVEARPKDFEML